MSDECAVCQTDVEGARLQLPCGHGFHASCIAEVFRRGDARCPLCRHNPYGDDSSSSGSTLFDFHHLEEMLTESAELRRRWVNLGRVRVSKAAALVSGCLEGVWDPSPPGNRHIEWMCAR